MGRQKQTRLGNYQTASGGSASDWDSVGACWLGLQKRKAGGSCGNVEFVGVSVGEGIVMARKPGKKSVAKLVKQLREKATGTYVWRVHDKHSKAYCIEFTDWEKPEAEKWWKENSEKFPDYHKNNELARVFFHTPTDRLMIQAALWLERFAK